MLALKWAWLPTMVLYFNDFKQGGFTRCSSPRRKIGRFLLAGALVGRLLGSWLLSKIKAGKLFGIFGMTAAPGRGCDFHRGILPSDPGSLGFFQLRHVPQYLYAGNCWAWANDEQRIGTYYDRRRRRSGDSVLIGHLVRPHGYQIALIVPALCYLFIAFYGFVGSKPTRTVTA